ncbi:MAG TPA: hypothetical protein DDW52_08040 [Planctomycetaceae bacterium]|nr:hypothetical protein [Planctomycetaceae bacterium]
MKKTLSLTTAFCLLIASASVAQAQSAGRTLARIFWQDAATQTIHWSDLKKKGDEYALEKQDLDNHPETDADRHMLVQMQAIDELIVAGVRDDDDGNFNSGWVAIHSGVEKESHGDHFHWHFDDTPRVTKVVIDDKQGNPAHVYRYGNSWYLANDQKNGITRISPKALRSNSTPDQFFSAGGGHITLAVSDDNVAYSTWIDREGDNKGRVDVVGLESGSPIEFSFHTPSGGLHGATYNSGKAFFAPSEGVCWVSTSETSDPKVHHIDLGDDASGMPKRTGAFKNIGSQVVFVAGRGPDTELCSIDADSAKPKCLKLALEIGEGNSATTPYVFRTRTGKSLAVMFEENMDADSEKMHVIDLDGNRDGDFSDAKLIHSMSVGKSQIQGHSGHHEICNLGGRLLLISSPGDGTIAVVSTRDWEEKAKIQVGGTPTRMLGIGG